MRPLQPSEHTPELAAFAIEVEIRRDIYPVGSTVDRDFAGVTITARVEQEETTTRNGFSRRRRVVRLYSMNSGAN